MSKGIVTRITCTLSLLLLFIIKGYSQDYSRHPVRFMFYNTENLFDIYNDSLSDDDEFTPSGLRRWNYKRYTDKVNALCKTILAAGEFTPPALVGLCEIENRNVLEDLVYGTSLAKFSYGIIHEDSPDPRGIDVCLIYRKELLKIIDYKYMIPEKIPANKFKTRSILYLKFFLSDDTVHLFLNHWPSRRGGVLAGETLRVKIAEMIRNKVDSIALRSGSRAYIIIAGDFNAAPDDQVIDLMNADYPSGISLINLSAGLPGNSGTYRYAGTWEMIDQVIVSKPVIERGFCSETGSLRIFKPAFLIQYDPKYSGEKPFATYLGYKYQGGYSDHLPVLLDLIRK
ncbi:MAG: endonuclease/exonuclease/phosphatase family protein [Bacteroidales bacterium]